MWAVCACVSVVVSCGLVPLVRAADKSSDKTVEEFKPRDVQSGEYPDYDKYVDMPDESIQQTLWRKVLREPKTKRPTKPMTKRRARMMKRRKVYDAILDMDEHFENALKEMDMDFKSLNKRNFTKIYLQKRAEREAEEARLPTTEPIELTADPIESTTESALSDE